MPEQRLWQQPARNDFPHRLRRRSFHCRLPAFRFGDKELDGQRQQCRRGARDHDPPPGIGRDLEEKTHQGDEQEAEVRGGADHAGQQRPFPRRPGFHHEGNSQRPLAAHAKRRDKPQKAQVPRLLCKVAKARKDRVGQNAQSHGPDPPQAVAQPAEPQAAPRSPNEKQRRNPPHPQPDELVLAGNGVRDHALQRRSRHQGEDPHLQTVEHPAEEGRRQDQPLSPGAGASVRSDGGGCVSVHICRFTAS